MHDVATVDGLGQVEIQPGEVTTGLGTRHRAGLSVIVQQPPAVAVVAAFGQFEPAAKQRKVSPNTQSAPRRARSR